MLGIYKTYTDLSVVKTITLMNNLKSEVLKMAWKNYKEFNGHNPNRRDYPCAHVTFSFCLKLAWKALKGWSRTACEKFELDYTYIWTNLGGYSFEKVRTYGIILRP